MKVIEFTNCLLSSGGSISLSSVEATSSTILVNTSSIVLTISTSPPDSFSSAVPWGISRKTLNTRPG